MKSTRFLAVPAVAAAALLALSGCIQLPPVGGATVTETETETETETGTETPIAGGDGGAEAADLAGTSWTGNFNGQVTSVAFTLNEDGTVDFADWAGSEFDSPGDVWSMTGDTVEMTITQIKVDQASDETFDVSLSGTAAEGAMSLSGEGTDGNAYELSASQD